MPDTEALAIVSSRADKVREIANGIFDKGERRIVVNFVAAAEKVAAERARDKAGAR
jgi:hypothetical protein